MSLKIPTIFTHTYACILTFFNHSLDIRFNPKFRCFQTVHISIILHFFIIFKREKEFLWNRKTLKKSSQILLQFTEFICKLSAFEFLRVWPHLSTFLILLSNYSAFNVSCKTFSSTICEFQLRNVQQRCDHFVISLEIRE